MLLTCGSSAITELLDKLFMRSGEPNCNNRRRNFIFVYRSLNIHER